MIHYRGSNHSAFATNNMDMTIRFWRDLLGMRLVAGISVKDTRQYFFEIAPNVMVSFFEWPAVERVPDKDAGTPVIGPFSFDHICIEVETEDDLWVLKDRLEAAGVWVTEVLDNGFIHSIFSTDPNNIQLEFCCGVTGVSLSESPRMVDRQPSAVTAEGADPQPGKWPEVSAPTPPDQRKIYPGSLKPIVE